MSKLSPETDELAIVNLPFLERQDLRKSLFLSSRMLLSEKMLA
jgi:hypothetical protein